MAKTLIDDITLYDYDSYYDELQKKREEINVARKIKVH